MEASLWNRCLRLLETEVPEQQFNTWVRPLQAVEENGVLRLLAPNRFVVDWLTQNLRPRIVELIGAVADGITPQIHLEVGSRPSHVMQAPASTTPFAKPRRAEALVVGGRLNPDFTFDNFVEGKSNQLARAAARQVAANPGLRLQPAVHLLAASVSARRHLMHAVANAIRERNPNATSWT
ncbi:MAG: chromosomal replication initiator protein DnaA, partial [Gammaproteobacteria bacterium]|nr:chromosomal replication initiator protein DnaA [Gammaproteobacteria bacterium]